MMPKTTKVIGYQKFGKPHEVLALESRDLSEVGPGEVLVKLLASPINPSDIGSILGKYGRLKELPAIAGLEGIGEVIETGSSVTSVKVGQWVQIPGQIGVWRELFVLTANSLKVLPDGLDPESACMSSVNPPTAIRLLEDFVALAPGDWIIQNGANSNVGIAVIQYARKLGIQTVNVVRREELIQPMLELGADVVVTEEESYDKKIKEITGGSQAKLALNSIGGESALRILNSLETGGTHVTFGAMSFEAIRFPTRQLIFEDIKLCGFWLTHWRERHSAREVQVLDDKVYSLIGDGTFRFPVAARYSLSEFRRALKHNGEPRFGKVLLTV